MAFRLILDENVEYDVVPLLEDSGHDVEHVDLVPSLGKGTADHPIARYSIETNRIIVTYDDDFVLEVPASTYRATLYFSDATPSIDEVADIIHSISEFYPQTELQGLVYAGREWLR